MGHQIQANLANLLTYIGSLYRNRRDAMKEFVSNSIDRWYEDVNNNGSHPCKVDIVLSSKKIIVKSHSQPGQDKLGLEKMMSSVAQSLKEPIRIEMGKPQIGKFGIGIFAFNQLGSCATFYSKYSKSSPTWKLVLRSNTDTYELNEALKREQLATPGMDVVISNLWEDPTKTRSSLHPRYLSPYLSEQFSRFLNEGILRISVMCDDKPQQVPMPLITFPRIGESIEPITIAGDKNKIVRCTFYYHPESAGLVKIYRMREPIVNDIKQIEDIYPGVSDSIYGSGKVHGFIDADFLEPLPSRSIGFVPNQDWHYVMKWLEAIEPILKDEVAILEAEQVNKALESMAADAKKMIWDIISKNDYLKELVPLGGQRIPREANPEKQEPREIKHSEPTGEKSHNEGDKTDNGGFRFSLTTRPNLAQPWRHSQFSDALMLINSINADYQKVMELSSDKARKAYIASCIAKEIINWNHLKDLNLPEGDRSLEQLLSIIFQVQWR